jgi:hypothetical protein
VVADVDDEERQEAHRHHPEEDGARATPRRDEPTALRNEGRGGRPDPEHHEMRVMLGRILSRPVIVRG